MNLTKTQIQILNKWIGSCRYLYNDVLKRIKEKTEINSFQYLRNKFVTRINNNNYEEWMFQTPKEVRAYTIRRLVTDITTNYNRGRSFNMRYKSKKKCIRETITIPKSAVKIGNGELFIYKQHKTDNVKLGNIKIMEEVSNIDHDIQIMKVKPDIWFLLVPESRECKKSNNEKNICAIDPGMKTFMTGVGIDGTAFKIGEEFRQQIKEQQKKIDMLKSKLAELKKKMAKKEDKNPELKNKKPEPKRKRDRRPYMRTKYMLYLSMFKLSNWINELHNKSIKFLMDRYDIILIPKLRMQIEGNNNFNREIRSLSFCKFVDKLKIKGVELGKRVIIVDESYTSKTCYECGYNHKIDKKQRICKCENCGNLVDRDINGAINILQKSIVTHSYK